LHNAPSRLRAILDVVGEAMGESRVRLA